MKSQVVLLDINSNFTMREVIEVDRKDDAWGAGYELAKRWGYRALTVRTLTISYRHFAIVFVESPARRFIVPDRMRILRNPKLPQPPTALPTPAAKRGVANARSKSKTSSRGRGRERSPE